MSLLEEPGDLARTPLAAVLLEALNLGATGVLEVVHGGGTSRLWFRDGRPVGAQVFAGFRPLGMMLLQAGRIDIETLSKSLTIMAETRRPQGEILVELGAVSREEVAAALAEQQAGYFGLIAALDAAPFAFDGSVPVPEWTRGSRLSPLRTIVDALERPQAEALVAAALQPHAAARLRLATGYREVADAVGWTAAERSLVTRLEAGATLEDFFASSAVPPERARAMLAALALLRLALPDSPTQPSGADADAEEVLDLALEAEAAAVPPRAPPPAPRAAGAPAPAPPPARPAPRSDPAEARARRQRLLQQAIRNMGVGPFARGAGERPAPTPREGAATDAPRGGGAAQSPAERQLRDALLAATPRARERSLFARLGLAETAGREEVKKAFLGIARQFHPDRFASAGLADLHDVVRDFFASMNEAYDVLSDDRKRAAYLTARKGEGTAHTEAARVDALKAEACLRTRDFARARGFLESAVRADPKPDYQAALAFAWLADPQVKDRRRARELLDEARRDPRCDRALYVTGILARDEGDLATAERSFREAIRVNPRNADAIRELRQVEARRATRRD